MGISNGVSVNQACGLEMVKMGKEGKERIGHEEGNQSIQNRGWGR